MAYSGGGNPVNGMKYTYSFISSSDEGSLRSHKEDEKGGSQSGRILLVIRKGSNRSETSTRDEVKAAEKAIKILHIHTEAYVTAPDSVTNQGIASSISDILSRRCDHDSIFKAASAVHARFGDDLYQFPG